MLLLLYQRLQTLIDIYRLLVDLILIGGGGGLLLVGHELSYVRDLDDLESAGQFLDVEDDGFDALPDLDELLSPPPIFGVRTLGVLLVHLTLEEAALQLQDRPLVLDLHDRSVHDRSRCWWGSAPLRRYQRLAH